MPITFRDLQSPPTGTDQGRKARMGAGAGELAQWIRTLALVEDLGSGPSTAGNSSVTPVPEDLTLSVVLQEN